MTIAGMHRAVVLAFLSLMMIAPASAARRVALVIGNAAYRHAPPLANPGNDAEDIAKTLSQLGFEVTRRQDLVKADMDRVLSGFAASLNGAEMALFFYAGHGLQVSGQNYLIPVDASLGSATALEFEAVRLDLVQRIMETETPTNVLILDACRDNPLARNLARSLGTRSGAIGRGLATQESGAGTLISYSTQPGNVALDGTGRNSPFAAALLKHLPGEGRGLTSTLIAVRNDVMTATARRQVPWEHSALTSEIILTKTIETAPSKAQPASEGDASGTAKAARDGEKTASLQDAGAPAPAGVIFEDRFDGDALGSKWTLRNEDKAGYLIGNGSMLLRSNKRAAGTDPPAVLSAPNALHLPQMPLAGDWDIAAVVRPDFGSMMSGAIIQIGLVDGGRIPLRASLVLAKCSRGQQLRLELVATGAREASQNADIWTSCMFAGYQFQGQWLSREEFGSRIRDLYKSGMTIGLHKRHTDFHATVIFPEPAGGKAQTQAITLPQAKGTPALAVRHDNSFGETAILLDDFSIREAQ
jgi:uncharacterized caspase-like protein